MNHGRLAGDEFEWHAFLRRPIDVDGLAVGSDQPGPRPRIQGGAGLALDFGGGALVTRLTENGELRRVA
jgi:hypothetical protein